MKFDQIHHSKKKDKKNETTINIFLQHSLEGNMGSGGGGVGREVKIFIAKQQPSHFD